MDLPVVSAVTIYEQALVATLDGARRELEAAKSRLESSETIRRRRERVHFLEDLLDAARG